MAGGPFLPFFLLLGLVTQHTVCLQYYALDISFSLCLWSRPLHNPPQPPIRLLFFFFFFLLFFLAPQMSPGLKGEVSVVLNHANMTAVWYFDKIKSKRAGHMIAEALHVAMYPPWEWVKEDALHIVARGRVLVDGLPKKRGKTWGEDVILQCQDLRKEQTVRVLTYTEVNYIRQRKIGELCQRHPEIAYHVRKAVIRYAVLRGIKRAAEIVKAMRRRPKHLASIEEGDEEETKEEGEDNQGGRAKDPAAQAMAAAVQDIYGDQAPLQKAGGGKPKGSVVVPGGASGGTGEEGAGGESRMKKKRSLMSQITNDEEGDLEGQFQFGEGGRVTRANTLSQHSPQQRRARSWTPRSLPTKMRANLFREFVAPTLEADGVSAAEEAEIAAGFGLKNFRNPGGRGGANSNEKQEQDEDEEEEDEEDEDEDGDSGEAVKKSPDSFQEFSDGSNGGGAKEEQDGNGGASSSSAAAAASSGTRPNKKKKTKTQSSQQQHQQNRRLAALEEKVDRMGTTLSSIHEMLSHMSGHEGLAAVDE